MVELNARYGVSNSTEVGARIWTIGTGVLARHALVRPADPLSGLNVSIESQLLANWTYAFKSPRAPADVVLVPQLGLYGGWRWRGHELLLVGRILDFAYLQNPVRHVVYAGATAGLSFAVHPRLRIGPQSSWTYPLADYPGFHEGPMSQLALVAEFFSALR